MVLYIKELIQPSQRIIIAVPDPDLEIRGGGGGERSQKEFKSLNSSNVVKGNTVEELLSL